MTSLWVVSGLHSSTLLLMITPLPCAIYVIELFSHTRGVFIQHFAPAWQHFHDVQLGYVPLDNALHLDSVRLLEKALHSDELVSCAWTIFHSDVDVLHWCYAMHGDVDADNGNYGDALLRGISLQACVCLQRKKTCISHAGMSVMACRAVQILSQSLLVQCCSLMFII